MSENEQPVSGGPTGGQSVERPACPDCAAPMVPIVYGYPGPLMWDRERRGEIVLGGCMLSPHNPSHQCANGHKWARADGRRGLDPDALAGVVVPPRPSTSRERRVVDGWVEAGWAYEDWFRDLGDEGGAEG
jgi:hypothetical protein